MPRITHRGAPGRDVEKILWLRPRYHFGPSKIAMYLQRYHQVRISRFGVWRILHKAA